MTDEVSIVEFSNDIAHAEAPVPLPMRQYPATIRKVEAKVSEKGNRYAAVSFYVSTDDYPADYPTENAPDGTTLIFRRVGLDDNAPTRYRLRKFLETIGAPVSARIDLSSWIGLTATIAIKHEEFEGEPRATIEKVLK
jgi:hypothetical protein